MNPNSIDVGTCCSVGWSMTLFFAMLGVPMVTETILIIYGIVAWPIFICTALLSVLALYGGFRLLTEGLGSHKAHENIFCRSPTQLSTLTSAGYLIYALPVWYTGNAIAAVAHDDLYSPWMILAAWAGPILCYLVGCLVGYAMMAAVRTANPEEQKLIV